MSIYEKRTTNANKSRKHAAEHLTITLVRNKPHLASTRARKQLQTTTSKTPSHYIRTSFGDALGMFQVCFNNV